MKLKDVIISHTANKTYYLKSHPYGFGIGPVSG